ncbi:hypothetical protein ACFZC3_30375 [Streptomyces sp. NPDC007903]|uniref:hypothetical protein n=1 Tax=Streptomyces sp. NPDC007903 TaxID=3364786 RepID=UPI0036E779FE
MRADPSPAAHRRRSGAHIHPDADTAPVEHGDRVLGLDGRVLLPGLWDARVHLAEWPGARHRLDLAGTATAQAVADLLRARGMADDRTVLQRPAPTRQPGSTASSRPLGAQPLQHPRSGHQPEACAACSASPRRSKGLLSTFPSRSSTGVPSSTVSPSGTDITSSATALTVMPATAHIPLIEPC